MLGLTKKTMVQERGGAAPFPDVGGVRTHVSFREERVVADILVEQQPPQGVFVCDHAGLVIN